MPGTRGTCRWWAGMCPRTACEIPHEGRIQMNGFATVDAKTSTLRESHTNSLYATGHFGRLARILATVLLPIAFAILALTPKSAAASNVQFVGTAGYSYLGNTATLTANKVQNFDSSGYSGTLKLELWALAAPY